MKSCVRNFAWCLDSSQGMSYRPVSKLKGYLESITVISFHVILLENTNLVIREQAKRFPALI